MKFQYIQDASKLNSFLDKQDFSQFLQSKYWQNILEVQGSKISLVAVLGENDKMLVSALIIKYDYKYFKYYYLPRGPIIDRECLQDKEESIKILKYFFSQLKKEFSDKKTLFFRLEPNFDLNYLKGQGIKFKKTLDIQPSKTRILDLAKSEKDLLADMHSKTRYNIRLAKRKGVEIVEAKFIEEVNTFIHLLQTTGQRNEFSLHKKDHYLNLYKNGQGKIKVFLAKQDNDVLAGAMFSFFGDTVTYLHGASANIKRNLMAPHLLQWYAILQAKARGFRYYDFGGISEKKWPGVTRFKAGFGGSEYNFSGTYDLILKPSYYFLYQYLRKLRRKLL